jgi:hypothetical protein
MTGGEVSSDEADTGFLTEHRLPGGKQNGNPNTAVAGQPKLTIARMFERAFEQIALSAIAAAGFAYTSYYG